MIEQSKIKGHLAVFGSNVIYGLNYVVAKGVMPDYFTPRAVIFVRVSTAMILFWILNLALAREKVEKKDYLKFLILSVFGIAINQIMFFEGLNLTTPINSSIIMTATPVLVLCMSAVILKNKITLVKLFGIIAGCSGAVMLILMKGEVSFDSSTFTGNLFTLINASSFGLYLVLVKSVTSKYKPVTIMTWIFTFGFVLIQPFCLLPFLKTDFHEIPGDVWFSLAYIVIGATFFGYLLYNYALVKLSATATSSYIYLQPVMAAIVAMVLGKDFPGIVELFSVILIFSGVYMASIYHGKADKQATVNIKGDK